jgi:hypothetical protein
LTYCLPPEATRALLGLRVPRLRSAGLVWVVTFSMGAQIMRENKYLLKYLKVVLAKKLQESKVFTRLGWWWHLIFFAPKDPNHPWVLVNFNLKKVTFFLF